MYSTFHILFFISVSILSLITGILLLWASSVISGIELTVVLFLNRNCNRNHNCNNGEPNVELHPSNNGDTNDDQSGSFEFQFASDFSPSYMTSADELFLNGEIQPMSPLQAQLPWQEHEEASHHHHPDHIVELDTPAIESGSASRSSSSGMKKWIFKVFTCSSSLRDEKKEKNRKMQKQKRSKKSMAEKPANGVGKRANRAHETKKKTSLLGICAPFWTLDVDKLMKSFTTRTKAIVLNRRWRIGWVVAPGCIASAIRNIHTKLTDSALAPFQEVALIALRSHLEYFESLRRDYESRRNYTIRLLAGVGFQVQFKPQGSFFLFAELPENCALSDLIWNLSRN
ncbi:unnamed protein product [Camellia sinensis]